MKKLSAHGIKKSREKEQLLKQGLQLQRDGKLQAAEALYRRVLELDSGQVDALHLLAQIQCTHGALDTALDNVRMALAGKPSAPTFLNTLGNILRAKGRLADAIAAYRQSLVFGPEYAETWNNLGLALQANGQFQDAWECFAKAEIQFPNHADTNLNIASLLRDSGKLDAALEYYRRSEKYCPNSPRHFNELGIYWGIQGEIQKAANCFATAIQLAPEWADPINNLANIRNDQCQLDEAAALFRRAMEIAPDNATYHGNLLFCLNYHPDLTATQIYDEYENWNRRHALPLRVDWQHSNTREPQRRIRIGYVSPDFKHHAATHFMEPLLACHDKKMVEVYAYANVQQGDEVTRRLRGYVDCWRDVFALNDERLADLIASDQIDILVDLAGHNQNNRLLAFARKPAPIQVSWLGYAYTTGLQAIDYFLSDAVLTPPGSDDLFSEKVVRLPVCLAYRPSADMPVPGQLPATKAGQITFGSLSRSIRVNAKVIHAWAEVLRRVPNSRLVINSRSFTCPDLRQLFMERFVAQGVGAERLDLGFASPPWEDLQKIDIGLDCFPHNSGTTLFETLYMGIPFISLADRPSVGRVGAAILTALGRQEWIAESVDEYIEKLVVLAADSDALTSIRAGLRREMESSLLMDERRFARSVEQAYRQMWQRWCAGQTVEPFAVEADGCAESCLKDAKPQLTADDTLNDVLATAMRRHRVGDLDTAEAIYRQVLEHDPAQANALHLLGVVAHQRGRQQEANRLISRAIELNPHAAEYYNNLGKVQKAMGNSQGAMVSYKTALSINPDFANALSNLGNSLREVGQLESAVAYCNRALQVNPNLVAAYLNLGNALADLHQVEEAVAAYKSGLALQPGNARILCSMGIVLADSGRIAEARNYIERALQSEPNFADAQNNRGVVLKEECRFEEALECYRKAQALDPGNVAYGSNQLYCLNYHPDASPETIFAAYCDWNARYAADLLVDAMHANTRDPERRLRIGYVSPDFRRHAARSFIEPVLAHHDPTQVEIFVYAEVAHPDEVTEAMRSLVEHWCFTNGMSDEVLDARIRSDGIDILVDLAGHTRGNRLLVFARKPAPVQVSWLGYACTTGLDAIDYFLGDATLVPSGSERLFSEKVVRLPVCLSYRPPSGLADPGPSPATRNGYVTFGSLSRSVRINPKVVAAWAEILRRVPASRLVINSHSFICDELRLRYAKQFADLGIGAERLEFGYDSPPWGVLRGIDIGLDCFPHNSGTTLFESLYMGVPIVTLKDRPPVGRVGAAILTGLGRGEWIAATVEEYIGAAVRLANEPTELAAIRAGLREEMCASSLMDENGFVGSLESAYRRMWQRWCAGLGAEAIEVTDKMMKQANPLPVDELATIFTEAVAHHQAGRLAEAEAGYRRILTMQSDHADSLHLLGVVAYQVGRKDLALEWIGRAISLKGNIAEYHSNYGEVLRSLGRLEEAKQHLLRALELAPEQANAALNLSATFSDLELFVEAEHWARRAITLNPESSGAYYNLAVSLKKLKRFSEAKSALEEALKRRPDYVEAMFQMGAVYEALADIKEAVAWYQSVLELNADHPEALNNLGVLLNAQGRAHDALAMLQKAAALRPGVAEIHCNLGIALQHIGALGEAETSILHAIRLNPNSAGLYSNYASVLLDQGKIDEAERMHYQALKLEPQSAAWNRNFSVFLWRQMRLAEALNYAEQAAAHGENLTKALGLSQLAANCAYLSDYARVKLLSNQALALCPNDAVVWSQRLYTFSYHPDLGADDIYGEFARWGEGQKCEVPASYRNSREAGRRLRVGFVSPDFRRHTSRFYFAPLFEHYDRNEIEFIAYSNVLKADDWTKKFQGWVDGWRDIRGMSDEAVARLVEADGIDILIDGCNHMQDHRLGVFTYKPAPVQVTWLGAAWTTGLSTVDYVLFDPYLAPEGTLAREQIVRLPGCFIAYRPPEDVGEVAELPAAKNKYVTFGYSGRTERLNHRTFRVWGEILRRLPTARLVLDYGPFADPATQAYYREFLARHGVDVARVEMRRSTNIFAGLNDIDILLDCFPHSGGTMLFDALWMGVPALTLTSRPPVGRIGTSLMMNLGLSEWVTRSETEYIERAVSHAQDIGKLSVIRAGMRDRMRHSSLMDEQGFARDYGQALRQMWQQWCAAT